MLDSAPPLTLEGWSLLHQMFCVNWPDWRQVSTGERKRMAEEAAALLAEMEKRTEGASAAVSMIGHKADLMLIHFRPDFEGLDAVQLQLAQLPLFDYLEPTESYVSVVELGLYDMTIKLHAELEGRGLEPGSEAFQIALAEEVDKQRERVKGRLFTAVPPRRHVCFYPMNKRRGESKNWYAEPIKRRSQMMREHGLIGRKYGGRVTQIISGSIGFDDWEWGVDLFADEPLVFKELIYEMRFDEASAHYAEFGPFMVGLQFSASELPRFLDGQVPGFHPPAG